MTTKENEKMSDKDLMEKVDKRRKEKDLTVREIGYLLGFSDTYEMVQEELPIGREIELIVI